MTSPQMEEEDELELSESLAPSVVFKESQRKRYDMSEKFDRKADEEASVAFNQEFKIEDLKVPEDSEIDMFESFEDPNIGEGDQKLPEGKIANMVRNMDQDDFNDLESADEEQSMEPTMKKQTEIKTGKVQQTTKTTQKVKEVDDDIDDFNEE